MALQFLRHRSLGTQLAWSMALVVGTAVLLLTAVLTSLMRTQIERDKGLALGALGRSITIALGKNLRDRMQQVELLADDPDLWAGGLDSGAVKRALERTAKSRPFPAWVGVADHTGRIVSGTGGLLVGQDASTRPWFAAGLREQFVGDVHQAELLAKVLPPQPGGEPLRLVDFAAPVKRYGEVAGVVALHGDVQGVNAIATALLPKNAAARQLEVYIFSRSGQLLFGKDKHARLDLDALRQAMEAQLPTSPSEQARLGVAFAWGDGHRYLTTRWSLDDYTPGWNLGWQVLVRQPVEIAYAPAGRAAFQALVIGCIAAVVAVALGGLLGRRLTRPLKEIALAARDVENGKPGATIPTLDHSRDVAQLSGALHSMTARLETLVDQRTQELQVANEQLRALGEQRAAMLDNELVGIVRLDSTTRTALWHNRAIARIFGYEMQELQGQPSRMLYGEDATYRRVGEEARAAFAAGEHYIAKVQMKRKDGSAIWIHLQGSALKEQPGQAIWMMTDVTTQHQYQQKVEHIAFHDPLTGLPNRLLLADRVSQALMAAARSKSVVAVAYLDLDGFKAVNDHHGHDAGDELLRAVADRAVTCVRAGDTVARLGGDEFAIVLGGLVDKVDCVEVLSRVLSEINRPFELKRGERVQVSGSIGVALYPHHGTKVDTLLAVADAGMYAAKRAGKGCIKYVDEDGSEVVLA